MRKPCVPLSTTLMDFGKDTDHWMLPASQTPANHYPSLQGLTYTPHHKFIIHRNLQSFMHLHNYIHSYFSCNCSHEFTCKGWASVHSRNMPLEGRILLLPSYTHTLSHCLSPFLPPGGFSSKVCKIPTGINFCNSDS